MTAPLARVENNFNPMCNIVMERVEQVKLVLRVDYISIIIICFSNLTEHKNINTS